MGGASFSKIKTTETKKYIFNAQPEINVNSILEQYNTILIVNSWIIMKHS